jgi:Zn-dependent peptidase ImmA (M78 family)
MARRDPFSFATRQAEELVRNELAIKRLEDIDPTSIAESRNIKVYPMSDAYEGVSGMLIKHKDDFLIAYNTFIKSVGFRRFSIGHEVGHYFLEGHIDELLPFGQDKHISQGGFVSDNRFEREADHFAVGLLMPEYLFRPAMDKAGEGLDAIETLRKRCRTSLSATAIRYQELTDEAVAVIQCAGNRIEYCCMSSRMLELKPGRWPRRGDVVPSGTGAALLHASPKRIAENERLDCETRGEDWFRSFKDVELFEETVGMGAFGRTLSVITTVDALPDEGEDEDDGDDRSWNRPSSIW